MANDREISYELALELAQFSKNVEIASAKVVAMDKRIEKSMSASNKAASGLTTSLKSMAAVSGKVFAAGAAVYYANQVRKIADEYQNINSRLKLVTSGSDELARVQNQLYAISQQTGTSYTQNAAAFAKMSMGLKNQGASSSEVLKINELMSKSLIIQGASAEEAASFTLQFTQALSSGVFSGEEFRAVMESNSYFASQLAKALGVDVAQLRKMSKEQKLTSDVLREAFPKMAEEINKAFDKIPPTTQRAMQALENSFGKIVDESNRAADGTGTIARSILELAQTIDQNRSGIISLFTSIISLAASTTQALGNIGQSIAGWQAWKDDRLGFLEFAVMDSKELNEWLKKNATDVAILDAKISQLKGKQSEVAGYLAYSPAAMESKKEQLAAIRAEIVALERQKVVAAGVAESQRRDYSKVLEWGGKTYSQLAIDAKKSADAQKAAQAAAVVDMKKKYQDYAAEVKRLQGEILGEEKSLDQQLREMKRSGMSEPDAWEDRKKQAQEYAVVAKAATDTAKLAMKNENPELASEMFKTAAEYAEMAKNTYADLNTEVKKGDTVIVTQADALKIAMKGVEELGRIKIEALRGTQELAAQAMADFKKQMSLEELTEGMDSAEKKWLENWEQMRTKAIKDIEAVEDRLIKIKDKEITVWINEKVRKKEGGMVQRFARGGRLPGYGGGDRISALLEAGEFVVRKEAVAKWGAGFFSALNSLRLPDVSAFNSGGMAGAVASADGSSLPPVNITLNYSGSGSQADAKRMASMVATQFKRQWRDRS